jgi:replicative DNA helicase
MAARYVDVSAIIQVIGNIYNNVGLLDFEDYHFNEDDFPEQFHKILFGSIFNLHALGAKEITLNAIEDYLTQRPNSYAVYKTNKGHEYLEQISQQVDAATFEYYYKRMKKFTLLRMYHEKCGMDLSSIYDIDNILNVKKKQLQEDWLDNTSLEEIADIIDQKITDIRLTYVENANEGAEVAGEGALELLEKLRDTPEMGYPLFSPLLTTITRGARLKKFYLRSAATGVGKTRAMIADACSIACNEIYDPTSGRWIKNGTKEPTMFITTEQEKDEVQTMMIAFISGVDEEHILTGLYEQQEWDRVVYAAHILKDSPLYVQQLPDFSMQDIENTIKRGIRDHNARYIFFDYIHTSMKILTEVTSKTGIKGLREDNVLFMISIRLKDICNQYQVFIMTATQLNADYISAQQYDQNLLRGAKAIADKIDAGMIMLEVSQDDLKALDLTLKQNNLPTPAIKLSVYKNRRGRYKDVLLWCVANRGTCRIEPVFVTDYQYKLIDIPVYKVTVKEPKSAF